MFKSYSPEHPWVEAMLEAGREGQAAFVHENVSFGELPLGPPWSAAWGGAGLTS